MRAIHIILAATLIFSSAGLIFSQENDDASLRTMETQVLKLVNEHRYLLGLSELKIDLDIHAEALKHSMNMANGIVPFSHDGFDGRAERLMEMVKGITMAENVALGQTTAQDVVESWLSSQGHKQNIEGNFNMTGIGIASGSDGELYFTQIFLLK